jgi:hypothetical protein
MNRSKKIQASDLVLNENAYFYKRIKQIDDGFVVQLFQNVTQDKKTKEIILNEIGTDYQVNGHKINYSLLIFNFEDKPTFIEPTIIIPSELKYSYLLIIQYGNFVIISKRNISGLKELYERVEEIDYYILSRLLVSNVTTFEKFNIKNMDISDTALRNKVLEALNLRNSLPIAVGNRYVLNSLRLNNKGERFSLSLNTSRINKLAEKIDFDELMKWIVNISKKIANFSAKKTYLDIFPIPIEYSIAIQSLTPVCILFALDELMKLFEDNRIKKIYYKNGDKKEDIKASIFLELLTSFEKFSQLTASVDEGEGKTYLIDNTIDKSLCVCLNDKSISCKARKLKKIILDIDGTGEQNLIELINKKQNFIINFNKPDYIYFSRCLFQDARLLNIIDPLMEIFCPFLELSTMTSEKGQIKDTLRKFSSDSLFGFIERTLLPDSNVLVCDDLSDEWADFIAIKNDELIFCNAKYSTSQMSASDFHVLVSQTQKNLGRFLATDAEWNSKTKWKDYYALKGVQTKIKRIRKGQDKNNVIEKIMAIQRNVNFQKKIWLVINYISKKELENEFKDLKSKLTNYNKPQVVQLLWLITSLVSICSEFGTQVKIACKE